MAAKSGSVISAHGVVKYPMTTTKQHAKASKNTTNTLNSTHYYTFIDISIEKQFNTNIFHGIDIHRVIDSEIC